MKRIDSAIGTLATGIYILVVVMLAVGACDNGAAGSEDAGEPGPAVCGDGVINGDEACDGTQLGARTCLDYGFQAGKLLCWADCTLSTENCWSYAPCRRLRRSATIR